MKNRAMCVCSQAPAEVLIRLAKRLCLLLLIVSLVPAVSVAMNSQSIRTTLLENNVTGSSVSLQLESDVSNVSTFSIRGLPPGLTLDEHTGTVTGTPYQAGDYPLQITQMDTVSGEVQVEKFRWVIVDSTTGSLFDENDKIPGQYVVAYTPSENTSQISADETGRLLQDWISEAESMGAIIGYVYDKALVGFSATLSDAVLNELRAHPDVLHISPVVMMEGHTDRFPDQSPAVWGIDRIDQRNLPLNNTYSYELDGTGVEAYVIDSGVRRTHTEFTGRIIDGQDIHTPGGDFNDCHGHGTHVTGTLAGTTYGVAKNVNLIIIRTLGCDNRGTSANTAASINWMIERAQRSGMPSVANISIGGQINETTNTAVRNAVNNGIVTSVSAGNRNGDACNQSPAVEPAVLTVAATDRNDQRADFSNFGRCVDLHAPGDSVISSWNTSDTATNNFKGTSMSSPHVAGVAALYRQVNPSTSGPDAIEAILALATADVVSDPAGSPNLLVYSRVEPSDEEPERRTIFSDEFETPSGWRVNADGTDTATIGQFEIADPQETLHDGAITQPGNTTSGQRGIITGPEAGSGVGDFDIDGGLTSITSPAINLPSVTGSGKLTLNFRYYLAHLNNGTADDYLRASVESGAQKVRVFEQLADSNTRRGSWLRASADLTQFAGQSVNLRFEAADGGTPSLIEAGVDDVLVTAPIGTDDPVRPLLSISGATVDENVGTATVEVTISSASTQLVEAIAFTQPGSATKGLDFYGTSVPLSFAPGETTKAFPVVIINDGLSESEESLKLRVVATSDNVDIGTGQASLVIVDDDDGGSQALTLQPVTVNEDVGQASVSLTLAQPATAPISLTIFTQARSATPGSDYYGGTQDIAFAVGDTEKTMTVTILDDSETETDEVIRIRVDNLSGAVINNNSVDLTIRDND